MRRTVASTEAARARASIVLPTPGTSSMSRCPSASRHTKALRTASGLPSITLPTDATIASVVRANPSAVSAPGASGEASVIAVSVTAASSGGAGAGASSRTCHDPNRAKRDPALGERWANRAARGTCEAG